MIDEIWNCRQVNDYSGKNCNKKDFMRSWTHSRTAQHISIEDLMENGTTIDGEQLYEIADAVGFKTAGAVSKHIAKIAGSYEDFVSNQYDKFLDEHTKISDTTNNVM